MAGAEIYPPHHFHRLTATDTYMTLNVFFILMNIFSNNHFLIIEFQYKLINDSIFNILSDIFSFLRFF